MSKTGKGRRASGLREAVVALMDSVTDKTTAAVVSPM